MLGFIFLFALCSIADPDMKYSEQVLYEQVSSRNYVTEELKAKNKKLKELKARENELLKATTE